MTTTYEIAPAAGGWVLKHEGDVLARYENQDWAVRVAKVMLDQGRRAGLSVQVDLIDRNGRARLACDS